MRIKKYDTHTKEIEVATRIESKTIEHNGNTIHYFVSGSERGEAIVFLHPAFGDHRCFDGQIDCFSAKYKVITVDMSGHGLTGASKSKDKISATAAHVAEILRTEGCAKAHLAGVSLGSLLVQDFALKYPDKVLSLAALGGYNINRKQPEVARSQRREIFKWLFKMIFSMDAFRRYVAGVSAINETEQARFYESAKHFTRRSFTVMSGLGGLIADRNAERGWPLLILSGEKDNELAVGMSKRWHEDNPDSEFHIIPNAGHCANMDNAEEFNRVLMDFITMK